MADEHAGEEIVEIQVKVPVAVNLRMKRSDAESMLKHELCRVVDDVLQHASCRIERINASDRQVGIGYDIGPSWDVLPDDECELMSSEEGLFPDGH